MDIRTTHKIQKGRRDNSSQQQQQQSELCDDNNNNHNNMDSLQHEQSPKSTMNDDGLWEKPAWAKGGVKLRSTGKADAMKTSGNLAAPITFSPFKNEDHSNKVANKDNLNRSALGEKMKESGNLAMPITNIRDEMTKQRRAEGYH